MNEKHPDDLIYDSKKFIKKLSKIQDHEFEVLVQKLKLNKLGDDWLFDYIFNNYEEETFEEYLLRYNRTMEEMID